MPSPGAVSLALPFRGTWLVRNRPLEFRSYRVPPRSGGAPVEVGRGVPGESEVVEPV